MPKQGLNEKGVGQVGAAVASRDEEGSAGPSKDEQALLEKYNTQTLEGDVIPDRSALPTARYRCKVKAIKLAETKAGDPRAMWHYEVQEGEHKGRLLMDGTNLMTKSMWVVENRAKACGMDWKSFALESRNRAASGNPITTGELFLRVQNACTGAIVDVDAGPPSQEGSEFNSINGTYAVA